MIQDALQPALEAFGVWLQLKKTSKGFVNVLYKHRGLRCSLHTHTTKPKMCFKSKFRWENKWRSTHLQECLRGDGGIGNMQGEEQKIQRQTSLGEDNTIIFQVQCT